MAEQTASPAGKSSVKGTPLAQALSIHAANQSLVDKLGLLLERQRFYERVVTVQLSVVEQGPYVKKEGPQDPKSLTLGLHASQPALFYDYLNDDTFIEAQHGYEREMLAAFIRNVLFSIQDEIDQVEAAILTAYRFEQV